MWKTRQSEKERLELIYSAWEKWMNSAKSTSR